MNARLPSSSRLINKFVARPLVCDSDDYRSQIEVCATFVCLIERRGIKSRSQRASQEARVEAPSISLEKAQKEQKTILCRWWWLHAVCRDSGGMLSQRFSRARVF